MIIMNKKVQIIMSIVLTCSLFLGFLLGFFYKQCQYLKEDYYNLSYETGIKDILQNGDSLTYSDERDWQMTNADHPYEFLFYSIVMAHKYHYQPAFDDIKVCIESFYKEHPNFGQVAPDLFRVLTTPIDSISIAEYKNKFQK